MIDSMREITLSKRW